jgi:serine/threonine protein kinase
MDFGLTYESGTDSNRSGTPAYMAPEVVAGKPSTIASDVYAIGVLLFNLLTAKYPVEGADLETLRAAHASAARRTLLDVRPDLPQALAHVVETAINPDPQKRFGSAGQMVAALSDAIGMGSTLAAGPLPGKPRAFRAWMSCRSPRRRPCHSSSLRSGALFAPGRVTQTALAGTQEDYRRARDLLAHHYRPHALETAIPLLEKIVAQNPRLTPAFADLARANFLQFAQQRDTKYIEPTREAALRALALAPDLASAHVTLGALYAWTAQIDLASHELEEALRLDKFNAAAWRTGGLVPTSGSHRARGAHSPESRQPGTGRLEPDAAAR